MYNVPVVFLVSQLRVQMFTGFVLSMVFIIMLLAIVIGIIKVVYLL